MKTATLIRVAAIITLLYCAGHTAGMPWTPVRGTGETAVIEAMKSHRFDTEGASRTYWDFYFGFGVAITFFLMFQAVVLWLLALLAKTDPFRLRPIIGSFAVAFLLNAAVAWKYFPVVPSALAVAIAVTLGLAFFTAAKPHRSA
jgi:hypothetical protein